MDYESVCSDRWVVLHKPACQDLICVPYNPSSVKIAGLRTKDNKFLISLLRSRN